MPNHEITASLLGDQPTPNGEQPTGQWAEGGASALEDFARTREASSRRLIPQGWQKPLAVLCAVVAMSVLMWLMPGAQFAALKSHFCGHVPHPALALAQELI